MNVREIVRSVVESGVSSYSVAFKLFGFLVFLAEEGPEPFLSGEVLSSRTYFRWIDDLRNAGLGELVLDARMRQLVQEYIAGKFGGLPINKTREKMLETVESMVRKEDAASLRAISHQAGGRVKGERSEDEGLEAKPRALDAATDGGSLREATARFPRGEYPRPVIRGWNVQDLNK
ncbi:MAG: hypothetical protein ACC700_18755 [Anaerolineales bacterium]